MIVALIFMMDVLFNPHFLQLAVEAADHNPKVDVEYWNMCFGY